MRSVASIPSPTHAVWHLGPLPVRAYALCIVVGIFVAVALTLRRWRARGGRDEDIWDVSFWAIIFGIIGGRLYHVITDGEKYFGSGRHPIDALKIWDGGLGIWGGIALGAAVGIWYLRRHLGWPDVYRFINAATPGLLVAQAIGRIGNYFNQELFGKPSTLPWALKVSAAHRPPGYAHYATYQPTFLYEIIWNLLLAAVLVWFDNRRKVRAPGLFPLYVAGYSLFRIFEETLRIDYSQHILGMRLNFWVALIGTLGGLLWFARIQFKRVADGAPGDADPTDPATAAYSQSETA